MKKGGRQKNTLWRRALAMVNKMQAASPDTRSAIAPGSPILNTSSNVSMSNFAEKGISVQGWPSMVAERRR